MHQKVSLIILAVCALAFVPTAAHAATLFVSPISGTLSVGGTTQVFLRVDSGGKAINAVEGVLSFDPAILHVQSVSVIGSIFTMRVQEPSFSNAAGTIQFNGVVLNPGFTGAAGNLLTVTLQAVAPGTARLAWVSGSVLANDGQGTDLLTEKDGASFTVVGGTPSPAPSRTPAQTPTAVTTPAPLLPQVVVPDPTAWYNGKTLTLRWALPAAVSAVSYLIDPKPDGNPGNRSDGRVASASFTDLPEGKTYFHIKFMRNGVWGPIAHVALNIDNTPPEPFVMTRLDTDPQNPRPVISCPVTDALSGVASHEMRADDGAWFDVPHGGEEAVQMPPLAPGAHEISMRVYDMAGNVRESSLTVTVAPGAWLSLWARFRDLVGVLWRYQPWPYTLGLIAALIALVWALRWLRRRRLTRAVRILTRRLTKDDKFVADQLHKVLGDIEDELAVLTKLSRHRGLYPEEKFLRSKLMAYRTALRSLLRDEVRHRKVAGE